MILVRCAFCLNVSIRRWNVNFYERIKELIAYVMDGSCCIAIGGGDWEEET